MLELYQFEGCPYCAKVRQKLCDLHLDYICRNVPKDATEKRNATIIKLGGKMQVPFLVDQNRGVYMYESDDIIRYLDETYGQR
ncbi:MAG TPA: glutathione S-transferase N-terminal domain-containing protein [Candidatus Kapabacteria bacterium]|nr:glutathione S-transferase N-terminal domain-containing protein [Candidatus Kapabacteria bacterium]